jgi:hypothetical protein
MSTPSQPIQVGRCQNGTRVPVTAFDECGISIGCQSATPRGYTS